MRPLSSMQRGRQKVVRSPASRYENEYNPEAMPQYFQIVVNVVESQHLTWMKAHSSISHFVVVAFGEKKYRTRIRKYDLKQNKEEVFIFNTYASLSDVMTFDIRFEMFEARCRTSRLLGEGSINLGKIWNQPDHQVFHKWIQLIPSGSIKVDLTLIFRELHTMQAKANDSNSDTDSPSLMTSTTCERQPANYIITVYGAIGLNNNIKKNLSKHLKTFITVSFCDRTARTGDQILSNKLLCCERISIVEMFPIASQLIRYDVWMTEGPYNWIVGNGRLNLADISHDGEHGFLPTFGPSLLHIYSTLEKSGNEIDSPYHRGALLIACNVVVPYVKQPIGCVAVEPVPPINYENLWKFEDFCIYCPIFEVSMIDQTTSGKFCGVAINAGETGLDNKSGTDFADMLNEIRSRKLHYTGDLEVRRKQSIHGYLEFSNALPILQFAIRLPDFRFRIYGNNMIRRMVDVLALAINDIEKRLKTYDYTNTSELNELLEAALEEAAENLIQVLQILERKNPEINHAIEQFYTELDKEQWKLRMHETNKIYKRIINNINRNKKWKKTINSKKEVKILITDTKMILQDLRKLIFIVNKSPDGWPNIVVWLLNGKTRVAYCNISAADVIYSHIPEQSGRYCGRTKTIFMKPLQCPKHQTCVKCDCIAAKIVLFPWMGLYKQKQAFMSCLQSFEFKTKYYDMCIKCNAMMVECRAFICKAKLKNDSNDVNSLQTFVRINALNTAKETKVQCKSLTPTWDQVLKIQRMVLMTPEGLTNGPPIVLVEAYVMDPASEPELFGRARIEPQVTVTDEMPKFRWYELMLGSETTGKILMACQLTQIPDKLLKNIVYNPLEASYVAPVDEGCDTDDYVSIPKHILPVSTSYKIDVYWWGLRGVDKTRKGVILQIEDFIIKSDIIFDKRNNCNFPNGRTSQILETPLDEEFPLMNIRLFVTKTFGRVRYLSTSVSKHLKKYMVHCLAKDSRDAVLQHAHITSGEFIRMSPTSFAKISSEASNIDTNKDRCSYGRTTSSRNIGKRFKWKNLFWQRELHEEEYSLLPVFLNATNEFRSTNVLPYRHEDKDWWLKYNLQSVKVSNCGNESVDYRNKLIIYDSELENRPEFSKFKDWCTTLKLYNGKKTGIPEADAKLYCGLLKAGFAIYRWSQTDESPVTLSGLKLDRGFFEDYPNNDPAKFLIRVYIVRGMNVKAKTFAGKSNPYVMLRCGSQYLGDRRSFVSNTLNPIFGQMFDLRCCLPDDYLLDVSLYNYDANLSDELIGCTMIDLENRIYSKHRAQVGLASNYKRNDLLEWRDYIKPSSILEELCSKNHLPSPFFIDSSTVVLNGFEYKNSGRGIDCRENLCLSILRKWHTLPMCGYHLVPEHVETRTLYHPDRPGIDQGKIEMWVDIFPLDTDVNIPPPIDVTPKKAENYELRVMIYSIQFIEVKDRTGKSDESKEHFQRQFDNIYVKVWLGFQESMQCTDVYYEYCPGEVIFNCRMTFQFLYQPSTQEMSIKNKKMFHDYDNERAPSILNLQLMNHEGFPPNDVLGSLTLNLKDLSSESKEADRRIYTNSPKTNLFITNLNRTWWPLTHYEHERNYEIGKIDLELTLLPQDEVNAKPVCLGSESGFQIQKLKQREKQSDTFCRRITNTFRENKLYTLTCVILFCLFLAIMIFLNLYLDLPAIILGYCFNW